MCKELEEAFGAVLAPDPETFGLYTVTLDHIPEQIESSPEQRTVTKSGGVSILWVILLSLIMTGCTLTGLFLISLRTK